MRDFWDLLAQKDPAKLLAEIKSYFPVNTVALPSLLNTAETFRVLLKLLNVSDFDVFLQDVKPTFIQANGYFSLISVTVGKKRFINVCHPENDVFDCLEVFFAQFLYHCIPPIYQEWNQNSPYKSIHIENMRIPLVKHCKEIYSRYSSPEHIIKSSLSSFASSGNWSWHEVLKIISKNVFDLEMVSWHTISSDNMYSVSIDLSKDRMSMKVEWSGKSLQSAFDTAAIVLFQHIFPEGLDVVFKKCVSVDGVQFSIDRCISQMGSASSPSIINAKANVDDRNLIPMFSNYTNPVKLLDHYLKNVLRHNGADLLLQNKFRCSDGSWFSILYLPSQKALITRGSSSKSVDCILSLHILDHLLCPNILRAIRSSNSRPLFSADPIVVDRACDILSCSFYLPDRLKKLGILPSPSISKNQQFLRSDSSQSVVLHHQANQITSAAPHLSNNAFFDPPSSDFLRSSLPSVPFVAPHPSNNTVLTPPSSEFLRSSLPSAPVLAQEPLSGSLNHRSIASKHVAHSPEQQALSQDPLVKATTHVSDSAAHEVIDLVDDGSENTMKINQTNESTTVSDLDSPVREYHDENVPIVPEGPVDEDIPMIPGEHDEEDLPMTSDEFVDETTRMIPEESVDENPQMAPGEPIDDTDSESVEYSSIDLQKSLDMILMFVPVQRRVQFLLSKCLDRNLPQNHFQVLSNLCSHVLNIDLRKLVRIQNSKCSIYIGNGEILESNGPNSKSDVALQAMKIMFPPDSARFFQVVESVFPLDNILNV